jgi:large subunit ribosomal protein L6
MSRVGQLPVQVPDGVDLKIGDGEISAMGKLGELSMAVTDDVQVTREDNLLWVKPVNDTKRSRTMWGTTRSLLDNLVVGVSDGFVKKLDITGVGYRAALQGKELVLQLGHSHEIRYPVPEGIKIEVPTQVEIIISGPDRQQVGQVAAEIRGFRKPEPYKGKGVRYSDEFVVRKEGKKK